MEWIEADPLPKECLACKEKDCYCCDHAGKRWFLSRKDELTLQRMKLTNAIARMERQIQAIDQELRTL